MMLGTLINIVLTLIHIGIVVGFVMLNVAYLTYFERKLIGHMQARLGPMRTGWHGILQPIADGIKLFFKEDIIPQGADKTVFRLAPLMVLVPALISFAIIPFSKDVTIFGYKIPFHIADLNIGILYILALSALSVYGIVMAGWSSNSKYSLLGGLRSSAQLISYEIAMGLSLIGVLMLSRSLNLIDIVDAQKGFKWFVFLQPLGFFIYFVSVVAETNRPPFDLPEAESELVGGFHTEYSGMRFAYFFLAEYANMFLLSSLAVILFLGGWHGPFLPPVIWFLIKVYGFLFLFYWFRGTLPRFRYDQLMRLGWKIFLPLALLNIIVTGLVLLV